MIIEATYRTFEFANFGLMSLNLKPSGLIYMISSSQSLFEILFSHPFSRESFFAIISGIRRVEQILLLVRTFPCSLYPSFGYIISLQNGPCTYQLTTTTLSKEAWKMVRTKLNQSIGRKYTSE